MAQPRPMATFEEVALDLGLAAGNLLRAHFGRVREVQYKGDVDLVTAADREAEAVIVRGLRAAYPTHRIVGEESGQHGNGDDFVWYVDPLDGTTNFVHEVPHYAVSIALVAHRALTAAVVHDPMRNETFHASLGRGSFLNGRPICVSTVGRLEEALVATGFSYDRRQAASQRLPAFERMLRRSQGIRRAGAAALDLAYVAGGRFDGYWESDLKPWDTAAGTLLVTEAGGRVSTHGGRPVALPSEEVVASNGRLHEDLLAVLAHPPDQQLVDGQEPM